MRSKIWLVVALVVVAMLLAPPASAKEFKGEQQGKHIGDANSLEYEIVYTEDVGTLVIDENGKTYYFNWGRIQHVSGSPDEKYYGTYAVYFIGQYMHYEVHLKNTGQRTYKNLRVIGTQEYHEDTEKGVDMPGSPTQEWYVEHLGPGDEVVLSGKYYAPYGTASGLDQTHLQISHWNNGGHVPIHASMKQSAHTLGRTFIDDPEAGVYCPP